MENKMQNGMTPEQAIEILDRAASRATLTREDHYAVHIATQTLKEFVAKPVDDTAKIEKTGKTGKPE